MIPEDTAPGNYYIVSRADWNGVVGETSDTNNDRASSVVKIGGDLVVSALTVAPIATKPEGSITVNDTTKNQGAEVVAASETAFYLSPNSSFNPTDTFLGSRSVPSLIPNQTSSASTEVAIPGNTEPGSYYLIAVADWNGGIAESTETNNTRLATVRVGPDLTVTSLTAPSSAVKGTSIAINHTTKNQGGDSAQASVTNFYLSTNSTLDASDVFLGSQGVSSLAPSVSVAFQTTLVIPTSTTAGSYYLIAKADGDGTVAESLENNNTAARGITVSAGP
jgi:subtilase family serine protease